MEHRAAIKVATNKPFKQFLSTGAINKEKFLSKATNQAKGGPTREDMLLQQLLGQTYQFVNEAPYLDNWL